MSVETVAGLIAAIIAIGGLLVSVYTLNHSTRKDSFERLERVVERMERQIKELQQENQDLRDWAHELANQLQAAGIVPAPFRRSRNGNGK
jgi:uncharacterized protein YoxC